MQRHRRDLSEPLVSGVFLQLGQILIGLSVADFDTPLVVGIRLASEGPVVDVPATTERLSKLLTLLWVRIKTVSISTGLLHAYRNANEAVRF